MRRILGLWLPDWPAQRARDGAQGNAHAPLALHTRDPRRGELIAATNAAARALGIRAGMPLAEAKGLLERTSQPDASARDLLPYDPAADRAALQHLAVHCERYSPLVALGQAVGSIGEGIPPQQIGEGIPLLQCDSLLLDVTGIGPLFGGEEQLAAAIVADFRAQGYDARVALAANVAQAWGLAHFPGAPWEQLPVEALRMSPLHAATLRQLGVTTIAQLAALPREALASRFGPELVLELRRAENLAEELITPVRAPPEFFAEWPLEHPTADRAALAMILEQLAQRVAEALKRRDQGEVRLGCRLDIAGHPPRRVEIGLFRPSADAGHFLELLRLQGEALALRGEIGRVGLAAEVTARLEHRQKQLFAAALDNHREELALLINRLSNRLGRERVARPRLTRDAVPEQAVQFVPLTGELAPARPASKSKRSRRAHLFEEPPPPIHTAVKETRPLSLLPRPVPLEVVSLAPDGPPVSFVLQGRSLRVARHWGPERIETAWWRGASVRRDYYRVEISDGRRLWLYRDRATRRWFLQGCFE